MDKTNKKYCGQKKNDPPLVKVIEWKVLLRNEKQWKNFKMDNKNELASGGGWLLIYQKLECGRWLAANIVTFLIILIIFSSLR